jgi:hypothetical protein
MRSTHIRRQSNLNEISPNNIPNKKNGNISNIMISNTHGSPTGIAPARVGGGYTNPDNPMRISGSEKESTNKKTRKRRIVGVNPTFD